MKNQLLTSRDTPDQAGNSIVTHVVPASHRFKGRSNPARRGFPSHAWEPTALNGSVLAEAAPSEEAAT